MLHLILIPLVAVATALSATQTASGQQLTEGYSATTTALPAGAGQALTTSNGVVYFDGFDLSYAIPNSTPQTLLAFPALTFGSFTIPVGATKVLFGESSNGGIWSVPLNGQPPLQIANVPLNYDAVMLDDDRALISAKTGGFAAADNDLIFVDLVTGQTQLLAQFPGASGPLAIDDADNVYYATAPSAFPAPAGTVSVLRLTNATINNALATNQVLGAANAEVIIVGLDAAGDIIELQELLGVLERHVGPLRVVLVHARVEDTCDPHRLHPRHRQAHGTHAPADGVDDVHTVARVDLELIRELLADDEPGQGEEEAPVGGHEGSRHQRTSTKERKNWA